MNKTSNKLAVRPSKKLTVEDLKKVIGGTVEVSQPTAEATGEDTNGAKAEAKAD